MVNCHVCAMREEEKKDEKGYFFLAVHWHVAQSSFTVYRKGHAFTS